MKIQKIVTIVALFVATLLLPSCVRFRYVDAQTGQPIGQQGFGQQPSYGQQGGQMRGTRRLDSVTVTKNQTGYCEAWTPNSKSGRRQEIANYASAHYMRTGNVPSETDLTQKYGFQCKARWVDTPDRVVGRVIVRPDEVPASIRAKFM